MKKIYKDVLQVELKYSYSAQSFTFYISLTSPRTILRIAAGPLAIVNIKFLYADAVLAAEDLLIGIPVLNHLGVYTKILLEKNPYVQDGFVCSEIS